MRLNLTEKNAYRAMQYLLWAANVKVSSTGLKEELCLHPDFPSLASVSDALLAWQTPNLATRLSLDQLKKIPLPALAFLTTNGGIFAPIKSVSNDSVEWLDTQKGWQKDPLEIFERKWNGAVLLLDPNAQSGEIDYSNKRKKDIINSMRIPFLIVGKVLCLALIFTIHWQDLLASGAHFQILLATKLIGTILGGMLLWQSLDSDNAFLQNICQLGGTNNCSNILQSKAAKVTPWLSWSELGFIYFAGGFLSLLFAFMSADFAIMSWLLILCVLVLPYTVYSVWYQGIVARQWCLLCLAVQFLFLLEAGIAFSYYPGYTFQIPMHLFFLLGISFIIPVLIWVLIKEPFQKASQLFGIQRELQKIKFNEDYISSIFSTQQSMPPIFEGMEIVHLGNSEANHVLTIVTNPLCWPCAVRHEEINNLLDLQPDVRCQLIFRGSPEALEIATVLLNTEKSHQKEAVTSWYQDMFQDRKKWIESHQHSIAPNDSSLSLHRRWCDLAGITGTPTIFFNEKILPSAYRIKDINEIIKYIQIEPEV